jgi:N-acetylmuramoyl-L-alanine amidase
MKFRSRLFSILVIAALLLVISGSVLAQRVQFSAPVMVVNTSFLNIRTGPGVDYSVLITVVGGTTLPVLGVANDGVWYQVSTAAGVGWLNSTYALARGSFANVPLAAAPPLESVAPGTGAPATPSASGAREWGVSVIVDHPLRATPAPDGAELTYLTASKTVIYTVVNAQYAGGVNWVAINLPGIGTGWLELTKVIFRPFACTLTAVEVTQNMPLKKGPDGTGDESQSIAGGQEAYLLDRVGEQYKIELINGAVGWVDGMAVRVRDANVRSAYCEAGGQAQAGGGTTPPARAARSDYLVVNTGYLNIRSGAGAQYSVVATVPGGTELPVAGISPDRVWLQVVGAFGSGWVNSEFVLFRGNGSRLPVISETVGQVATPKAVINQNVILYAAPNLTLGTVGSINAPAEVDVVARTADGNWVQIRVDSGYGWVQSAFVTLQGNLAQIPVVGG